MKHAVLPFLLLTALITAVILHAKKIKNTGEPQDIVAFALQGLKPHLHPHRQLPLVLEGVPGEVFFYTRLELAPRHLTLVRQLEAADTFLRIVAVKSPADTPCEKPVLWDHSDRIYHYQLLSAR